MKRRQTSPKSFLPSRKLSSTNQTYLAPRRATAFMSATIASVGPNAVESAILDEIAKRTVEGAPRAGLQGNNTGAEERVGQRGPINGGGLMDG